MVSLFSVPILFAAIPVSHCIVAEHYSQNSLCRQNACVNPIFPGLMDLGRLDALEWQCAEHAVVGEYLDFCREAVNYDSSLPSPNATSVGVDTLVKAQDDAAATMFFYHMNGIGYDAWDDIEPRLSSDSCVRSVWRMVCFTYFPRAQAGCRSGERSLYMRPCMSSCENYINSCGVECCDESVSCSFSHTVEAPGGLSVIQSGYVDAHGPSALCTGAASRGSRLPLALLFSLICFHVAALTPVSFGAVRSNRAVTMAAVAMIAVTLQGCDLDVPRHEVGNWRQHSDYLVQYEFIAPGQMGPSATLNSCTADVAQTLQCSGHGYCRAVSARPNSVSFCLCDRDWADPECRTQRKSQTTTFLLSLFLGFLGADLYYLGLPVWAFCKMATLGGFGFWWLLDIIRTGAGPVYAANYRVSADLPHWVFVLSTVFLFVFAGFFYSVWSYMRYRIQKREAYMRMRDDEEFHHYQTTKDAYAGQAPEPHGLKFRVPRPGPVAFEEPRKFGGYGSTLPVPLPTADAPYGQCFAKDADPSMQLPPIRLPPIAAAQSQAAPESFTIG